MIIKTIIIIIIIIIIITITIIIIIIIIVIIIMIIMIACSSRKYSFPPPPHSQPYGGQRLFRGEGFRKEVISERVGGCSERIFSSGCE